MCVKSGVQMPEAPIGIMASDEEAYRTFNDLFGPIIKDIHPKFDFRYSYKFSEITVASLKEKFDEMQRQNQKCERLKITLRRNFRGMPFSPLMTKEAKLQIERKVVEVLGELYGKYK
jgi:creatine kinase/arginine kinase